MRPVNYHTGRFPPEQLDWSRLIPYLGAASAALARYDGMLAATPAPDVLLAPLTTQEALLSSRIEGTQATMGEVLEFEAGGLMPSPERREELWEILNYRAAIRRAERLLEELPMCQRVILEMHSTLMAGVRGQSRAPGAYRKIPNWIGPPGCTMETARFVPISAEHLPDAMSKWERYAHQQAPDRLVQLGILHAEFEALHPFLDGNGRLGRMLIPLFLWQWKLMRRPVFYISGWLEQRREEYYERLLAVSRDDDWTGWSLFFLQAVQNQAERNLQQTQAILALYESLKHRLPEITRSQYAILALDWIFNYPVFNTSHFIERARIPTATARRFLKVLRDQGTLTAIRSGKGRRPTILAFLPLVSILESEELR